jgi:hypothetical protein
MVNFELHLAWRFGSQLSGFNSQLLLPWGGTGILPVLPRILRGGIPPDHGQRRGANSVNTTEKLHPVQIAAWRRMTPAEKWKLAQGAQKMIRDAARRRID